MDRSGGFAFSGLDTSAGAGYNTAMTKKTGKAKSRTLVATVTLADCDVDTFRSGGSGGQNVNKRDTGVRITHRASGAIGKSTEERSQLQNKKTAWKRMCETPEFRLWTRKIAGGDELLKAQVERELWPDRLQVDVKGEDGRWTSE